MKYYSDITNKLYQTREELFKAERDYKTELIAKARADEKARKIADLEAQLAELKGGPAKTKTIANTDADGDRLDVLKTAEAIKKMINKFKFKYPTFEFPDVKDGKDELTIDDIRTATRPGEKNDRPDTEKTVTTKTNGTCAECGRCAKSEINKNRKRDKLADSGYYSSAYVNLNGKEFYAEGADSWNDVKSAIREYLDKLHGLK